MFGNNKYYYIDNKNVIPKYFEIVPYSFYYNYDGSNAYIKFFNKEKIGNIENKVIYDINAYNKFCIFTANQAYDYYTKITNVEIIINSNIFKKINSINLDKSIVKRLKGNMVRLAVKKMNKNKDNKITIKMSNGFPDDEVKKLHDDMHKILIFA